MAAAIAASHDEDRTASTDAVDDVRCLAVTLDGAVFGRPAGAVVVAQGYPFHLR